MRRTALLFTLLAGLCFSSPSFAYTLELTDQQLQGVVETFFPFKQQSPFTELTLSQPAIQLDPKSNRVGLAVSVDIGMQGVSVGKGRGLLDGELEYRADTGEFYLRDPKLKQIQLDRLRPQYHELVKGLVNNLAYQTFPFILVYQLKDDDIKQILLKNTLQSVKVQQGKLVLKMSRP